MLNSINLNQIRLTNVSRKNQSFGFVPKGALLHDLAKAGREAVNVSERNGRGDLQRLLTKKLAQAAEKIRPLLPS
jgi:hypothetical protein